jgi:hypothetical protein
LLDNLKIMKNGVFNLKSNVIELYDIYIVTCYATKDAVWIGNPFIIILNYT